VMMLKILVLQDDAVSLVSCRKKVVDAGSRWPPLLDLAICYLLQPCLDNTQLDTSMD
jgi:hypothetical protein